MSTRSSGMDAGQFAGVGFLVVSLLLATTTVADPVRVYLGNLQDVQKRPLIGYPIELFETNQTFTTDANGEVLVDFPVGTQLTFNFPGKGDQHQIQAGTVFVPPGGLSDFETRVILTSPTTLAFDVLMLALPAQKDPTKCQVITTVCNINRTISSFPQGIPGAVTDIVPARYGNDTFYFGTWGDWSNYTNPLPNDLTSTSWDGGVYFPNVDVDPSLVYQINASRPESQFTLAHVRCTKGGQAIHAAPNQGPRMLWGPQ